MLTDKERGEIIKCHTSLGFVDAEAACKAIERAVLAKSVSLDGMDETEGFIDFFNERLNFLADRHPTKIVRQMAQLLRKERNAKAVEQEPVDWILSAERESIPLYASPLPAQAIPEGWQLVPTEPTLGMLKEIQLIEEFSARALAVRYKAMLSASPKP